MSLLGTPGLFSQLRLQSVSCTCIQLVAPTVSPLCLQPVSCVVSQLRRRQSAAPQLVSYPSPAVSQLPQPRSQSAASRPAVSQLPRSQSSAVPRPAVSQLLRSQSSAVPRPAVSQLSMNSQPTTERIRRYAIGQLCTHGQQQLNEAVQLNSYTEWRREPF